MIPEYYSIAQVADMLSISKETLKKWARNGKLVPHGNPKSDIYIYHISQLDKFQTIRRLFNSQWDEEMKIKPLATYTSIELFAGAGGLALGIERAGFQTLLLNEIDRDACSTLRLNRPAWNVVESDISKLEFREYTNQVDLIAGGFPCQAFSYAGKKLGFDDIRGTLFFEFARAIQIARPKVILAENVRGLLNHDKGKTMNTILNVVDELGYRVVALDVLQAIFYQVPQKRERLFLVGVRKDLADNAEFYWPSPYKRIMTLKDALKAGELYATDVPPSEGQAYPKRKAEILAHVPEGGYWRDLPDDLQREYMQNSYFLSGGKTGMARRLAWDEPSLTLTCSPAQKQTERCHPEENRPLTVREYARIQTFPDDWQFSGSLASRYKQIGNAVPVNLAYAVGRSLIRLLNSIALSSDTQARSQSNFYPLPSHQLELML